MAIFGDVTLRPPVLAETRRVLFSARQDAKEVTLISRWHGHDYRVQSGLGLKDLIDKLARPLVPPTAEGAPPPPDDLPPQGLDLGYSDVVGVLYELSRKKALGASLLLQPLTFTGDAARLTTRPIAEKED